jgi:hypothetical protein
VKGISINSGYTGTVTQNSGNTVTVGTSGYSQADGTFAGGNSEIQVSSFTQTGGTFTATSGNTTIFVPTTTATNFTYSGGTFQHGGGTLRFRSGSSTGATTHTISLANDLTVNNLQYEAGLTSFAYDRDRTWSLSGAAAKFIVLGDFTMRRATGFSLASNQTSRPIANNGTIELRGNLVVDAGAYGGTTSLKFNSTGAQTYSSNGGTAPPIEIDKTAGSVSAAVGTTDLEMTAFTLLQGIFNAPTGNLTIFPMTTDNVTVFTFNGGAFNHSSGTLRFRNLPLYDPSAAPIFTISLASALTVNNLQYEAAISRLSYDYDRTWLLSGVAANFIVLGDFTMRRATGFTLGTNQTSRPIADGGVIELRGNLVVETGAYGGSTVLKLNGTGTQTYTYTGGITPKVEIDKTAGSVTAAAGTTDFLVNSFTLTQGTFNAPTGNLTIYPMTGENESPFTYTAGNFNHSNGTLRLRSMPKYTVGVVPTYTISIAAAVSVNNLQYEAGD